MKLTRLETVRLDEFPNLLWVRVHTDHGLVDLGATLFGARTVAAIKRWAASSARANPLAP